jgi:cell division cycle protein 20 (cofactor of APC complex)
MSPAPRRLCTPNRQNSAATPYFTPKQESPSKTHDDRFIPSRRHMSAELCRRALAPGGGGGGGGGEKRPREPSDASPNPKSASAQETPLQKEYKRRMLSSLCNVPLEKLNEDCEPTGLLAFGGTNYYDPRPNHAGGAGAGAGAGSAGNGGTRLENPFDHDTLRTMKLGGSDLDDPAANLSVAKKVLRKVPSAPLRILDAPDIVDDYYLNLISWGQNNILAVALAQSVYLWNATSGEIQHLITVETASDYITSVCWCTQPGQSHIIAVGTNDTTVHLFDAQVLRKVRTLQGHSARVSSLAWNQHWLTSGGRDAMIHNHDIRASTDIVSKYKNHEQEVCGLKWNDDGTCLASGSNDNTVCLWDSSMSGQAAYSNRSTGSNGGVNDHAPRLVLDQHKAAVKALDWCPFHRGLLASGGGTADRSIKFWNTSSGAMLNSIDTGSQVCSIVWSKHQRELCSSHGYSENQLILWKYPTMTKIKELTGHTARVLNMELSPDGSSVVSAAADETLRFWDVFGSRSSLRSSRNPGMGVSLAGSELSFGAPCIR